jgi:signal transduction histidine kinase
VTPAPELEERIRWFIRLRWLAAAGIAAAALAAAGAGLPVLRGTLLGLAGLLAPLNAAFLRASGRRPRPLPFAAVQIAADLGVLTLALHASGGIENPCAFFYVFHVIIAAILLPPRVATFVAGLASACFVTLAGFEHIGFLPHVELGVLRWHDPRVLAVGCAVMIFTLFVAGYLASTIMEGLRRKDAEMRRFNERLLRTEKLAAIGQLAAGVAHELNTPLASIAGTAEELQAVVRGGGETVERYAGVIRSQTERCKGITQSLLNFARKGILEITSVDVNAVVREAADYLRFKRRGEGTGVILDLSEVPPVRADAGQLFQVFLSLLVNAADATEGGGRITARSRAAGGSAVVEIEDGGCGIPEENLKKVLEPFFTTKEPGRGTGLGLSLSYGIVTQLGGSLDLKSRVGAGTTVTVTLPAGTA